MEPHLTRYYISYVNLDSRTDRRLHMGNQLAKAGIEAVRTRGMKPEEYRGLADVQVMRRRTPGAIGCHFSQVSIMQEALAQKKHAMVLEDDIIFCSDFKQRLDYIEGFCDSHPWDVVWLGAAFHVNPPYWHPKGNSRMSPNCSANLGYDAKVTDDPRMVRTFGAFATFAYIVNVNSIDNILKLFDRHIHESIGIDFLFVKLQPQLKCYSFVPGCVRQMDNKSDIGNGMTIWSGFLKLNGTFENSAYVYQDKINDFNPETFNWSEAK